MAWRYKYLPKYPYFLNKILERELKKGIWPWQDTAMARLPEHFKKTAVECYTHPPLPVHYRPGPEYTKHPETGEILRHEYQPIPILNIKEMHNGLWGGEGIVKGFHKKGRMKRRYPHFWRPFLEKRVFHSEILEKWMLITVTQRTLDKIDEAFGFDYYILKTHEVDLNSKLGMKLKREMLTALSKKTFCQGDPIKANEIYDKYKQFVIPEEEIEWLGLSFQEAYEKQLAKEQENKQRAQVPLKDVYRQETIQEMLAMEGSSEDMSKASEWLSKLNPFGAKKS